MADEQTPPSDKPDRFADRVQTVGSVHDAFRQSVQEMLADRQISEEERQRILSNMSCPCCGGQAASFTVKLGSR